MIQSNKELFKKIGHSQIVKNFLPDKISSHLLELHGF